MVQNFKNKSEMEAWIPKIEVVERKAFAEILDYIPSTQEEFELLARNIIAIADPKYIKMILHGDEVAGFLIAYPNINRGLRFARGRMFPFGWLGLLLDKKFSNVIDLEGIGLMPEYQGLGGNAVLYAEIDRVLITPRFKRGEIVQIDERNFRSRSDMQTMQVVWDKVHRTFKKVL